MDIDILTDKKGIFKIDKLLKEYSKKALEYSSNSRYKSYYSTYEILDVNIDLMSNFQYKKKDNKWSEQVPLNRYKTFHFEEMDLKLLPLDLELKEYYQTNRLEKYTKIKEFVEK